MLDATCVSRRHAFCVIRRQPDGASGAAIARQAEADEAQPDIGFVERAAIPRADLCGDPGPGGPVSFARPQPKWAELADYAASVGASTGATHESLCGLEAQSHRSLVTSHTFYASSATSARLPDTCAG